MSRASYAVAWTASRDAAAVHSYRGLGEPKPEVVEAPVGGDSVEGAHSEDEADDDPEYLEVDEAALERVPSEASSEGGATPPSLPPRRVGPRRAPLPSPMELLPPPHERTVASRSASPSMVTTVILEEDEDEERCPGPSPEPDDNDSVDLYSVVIEEEDLYVTVPSEWDGEGSFYSSTRSAPWSSASAAQLSQSQWEAPPRPPRPPAEVVMILESSKAPAQQPQGAQRPPDDLPDERPVPRLRLSVRCCWGGKATLGAGSTSRSNKSSSSLLALPLLVFALLVSVLLINLASMLRCEEEATAAAAAAALKRANQTSPSSTMSYR